MLIAVVGVDVAAGVAAAAAAGQHVLGDIESLGACWVPSSRQRVAVRGEEGVVGPEGGPEGRRP